MRKLILLKITGVVSLLVLCSIFLAWARVSEKSQLLIRIDDIGMNHSVNMALQEIADKKLRLSASVMFACPWYQEAVEILKKNPQIGVGVHLTLNSEWKYYRWGPILGREAVPSLVDDEGYFHHSTKTFLESGYKLDEVEKELEAQIQRAIATGLKIEYIDFHMRTAIATPELANITIKLAQKYKLKRSMFMNEKYKTMFDVALTEKKKNFLEYVKNGLSPNEVNIVIIHAAKANPEMNALIDMNNSNQGAERNSIVAQHRQAELNMLVSPEFQKIVKEKNIQLVNYADLPSQ